MEIALEFNKAPMYAIGLGDTWNALSLVVIAIGNAGIVLREASASRKILRFFIPLDTSVCAQSSHHSMAL